MTKTQKEQLSLLRQLKAIARRKTSQRYWDIPVPPDKAAEFKADILSLKRTRNNTLRKHVRSLPKQFLNTLVMDSLKVKLTPEEKTTLAAWRQANQELIGPIDHDINDLQTTYQKQVVAEAVQVFSDLERLELEIIGGVEVDLAPYARRLMD